MNPFTNKFEPLLENIGQLFRPDGTPVPKHWCVLKEGELVVLKNYSFEVVRIGEGYLVLEPVGPLIVEDK